MQVARLLRQCLTLLETFIGRESELSLCSRCPAPHIEMLNQKHAPLFTCNERKNTGRVSWKIDWYGGSRFQPYLTERERGSLGRDGFYIILCHQTARHLILSSASLDKSPPFFFFSPFSFV